MPCASRLSGQPGYGTIDCPSSILRVVMAVPPAPPLFQRVTMRPRGRRRPAPAPSTPARSTPSRSALCRDRLPPAAPHRLRGSLPRPEHGGGPGRSPQQGGARRVVSFRPMSWLNLVEITTCSRTASEPPHELLVHIRTLDFGGVEQRHPRMESAGGPRRAEVVRRCWRSPGGSP